MNNIVAIDKPNTWMVWAGMVLASFSPRYAQALQTEAGFFERPVSVSTLNIFSSEISKLSENYKLSDEQAQLAESIYQSLPEKIRINFLRLAQREIGEGASALLSLDKNGHNLLQNLATFTALPFHPEFEKDRAKIIDSFLLELAQPGELNQANHGTCATGMHYVLYIEQPAEALRIMQALLSEHGETTLRDGSTIKRARYVFEKDRSDQQRSISEKVMQSALMELGNGKDLDYCNHCDEHFYPNTGVIWGQGLGPEQVVNIYKALFGHEGKIIINNLYKDANYSEKQSVETLIELIKSHAPDYTPVSMKWSSGIPGQKLERKHLSEKVSGPVLGNEPHHVLTGGPNKNYGPDGYHFVLVKEIKDGRVYFRNLHGPSTYKTGTVLTNPPRVVEDPSIGLESMDLKEFSGRLHWIIDFKDNQEIVKN